MRSVRFAEQLTGKYGLKIKIGLNFGPVFAGVIGSNQSFNYTGLGDAVNFASRITTRCRWGDVWMSEKVAESIESYYQSDSLGSKKFKGKKRKQTVFRLIGKTNLPFNLQFPGKFIGREKELKKLNEYIQPITKGKFAGIVYIKGEAGIGKSRLISQFLENINFPYQLVSINPDQVNQISLYGISKFLKQYFHVDNLKRDANKTIQYEKHYFHFLQNFHNKKRIMELNRIKTILGAILGLHWENSIYENIKPEQRPQAIVFAFKEFLISLSSVKPLIIVVEDFQWLDRDSVKAITVLTRSISSHPIVLILLGRYNDKDKLAELPIDQSIPVKTLSLEKFSDHLTVTMLKHFLNIKPDQEFLNSLYHKAQGNPLFIEQYCLYLKNKYTHELTPQIIQQCQIPSTVNSILIARIDQLNKSLKDLVKLASVFGMEFRQDSLTEVIKIINSSSEYFINHLFESLDLNQSEQLMKEGIEQNIWNILSELKYSFNHSLFREAAYQIQLKKILRTLHLLIAELFSKKEASNPEHYHYIAYHFHQAEKFQKAIDFYRKAAHYSKNNYKLQFSIDLWKKAIYLTEKIYRKDSKQLDIIYLDMTKTLLLADKFNEALIYLDKTNIPENFGKESSEYAELLYLKASALEAIGEYNQALKQQQMSKNIRLKLWGENNNPISENLEKLGWIYWDLGKYDRAITLWNKTLKIREKLPGESDLTVADILDNLGTAYSGKGNYEKSYSYHLQALKIRKDQPNRQEFALGYSYNNLACVLKNLKKLKQALDYSLKSLDLLKSTIGEK
ncbi:MAG: tetratricopeptide repeat protein [bacterium]